jgi:hypothetical protein
LDDGRKFDAQVPRLRNGGAGSKKGSGPIFLTWGPIRGIHRVYEWCTTQKASRTGGTYATAAGPWHRNHDEHHRTARKGLECDPDTDSKARPDRLRDRPGDLPAARAPQGQDRTKATPGRRGGQRKTRGTDGLTRTAGIEEVSIRVASVPTARLIGRGRDILRGKCDPPDRLIVRRPRPNRTNGIGWMRNSASTSDGMTSPTRSPRTPLGSSSSGADRRRVRRRRRNRADAAGGRHVQAAP